MTDVTNVHPLRRRVRPTPPADPDARVIKTGADVYRMVDEAAAALAEQAEARRVFARGGSLVRVVRDAPPPSGVTRAPGATSIRPLHPATLLELLSAVAYWQRFDRRSETWVPAVPPAVVVHALLERGHWPNIPQLVGVLETPSLRPDGTLIQEPGHDPSTCFLYMPTTEFDRVLADPSRDDVERARDQLLEVVVDFPFAKEEHRSAWLAFLLTLIARPAIAGCIPLIDTDATTAGTGKGKLIDAASIIATGREATKTPLPSDDDEFRKRITSLVSEGEGLAVLDNVTSTVNSAALDAALTATMWKDRVLGRSATVTAPNLLVWAVTGNNVQLGADTARRTLHIRLESRVESPENRSDFRHPDLLAWVRDNRPRLVTAALTILRGYFADGAKDMGVKPWGSFEGWSRTIANCVVWAGLPDPQATRLELASMADATNNSLSALIEGWSRLAPHGGLSAKSAIAVLYTADHMRGTSPPDGHDDLRETIETIIATSQGKQPSAARLGYTLRRFRRRIVGGRMLDCQTDRNGVAKWAVIGADNGESRTYALPSAGDAGDEGDVSSPSRRRMAMTNTGVGGRNITRNAPHPPQGSLVDVEREAIQAEAIGTLPERQYSSLSPNERMAFDNGVVFQNLRIVGAPQRARAR